jgi:hypothetical protein
MDKNEFKKILFKVAFCTIACDGHIDDREVEELKTMDKNTSFFEAIDLSDELEQLITDLKREGTKVIEELFSCLRETKLNQQRLWGMRLLQFAAPCPIVCRFGLTVVASL